MKKLILASAVAAALAAPAAVMAQAAPAAAPASPHTFTGNVTLASDYRFRGISQTFGKPAIQGGFDYSHASGFYLGTWASNVYGGSNNSGLGVNYAGGSMEWDFYGGYKWEAMKDLTLDVGLLQYYYPGAKYTVGTKDKYDNTEVYLGGGYKWFTAKYSYAISDYFGAKTNTIGRATGINSNGAATGVLTGTGSSKGSGYLDLGATFEIAEGFNLVAHVGKAKVKNYSPLDYTDYKIGITKDWGGFSWGLSYIDSNAKADVYRTQKQVNATTTENYDTSKGTVVFTVGKTF